MTETDENFSQEIADKAFVITMVLAALFIGAVFIFIL
tara:strand:- start:762 stop:872 length:111 start_codon:yes stop_codon:yes gene_type:complete